ncbi:hypothetical protein K2173_024432 [Erythroxylum novogranatense]|uniref:Polygalacturonase n=1 Tax=Erythroxylum novogranatense TaxID=1862640 RepID=A0AAV8SU98_9ROSI|nr:hypothetical protein K2173_024432 [Erythroxylum novogranatense]
MVLLKVNELSLFEASMDFHTILCLAALLSSTTSLALSVVDFGAVGDGKTDDSRAFEAAWQAVCQGKKGNILIVPRGKTFLIKPVSFQGPCGSHAINFQVEGTIVAPTDISQMNVMNWIEFDNVKSLTVDGNGLIDGKGSVWWAVCRKVIAFNFCTNFLFRNLKLINGPSQFVKVFQCRRSTISGLTITAPEDSPNTDGINISHSESIFVLHSNIASGDDCISVLSGSSNINVSNITCGPGHGISIGSIGMQGEMGQVEGVHVSFSTFTNVLFGARIKTWQGGKGYVRKIKYEHITLKNAGSPVIIDQYYCPAGGCANKSDAVAVSGITFDSFQGTSSSDVPIQLLCSQNKACTDLLLNNVKISPSAGQALTSKVINAHGTVIATVPRVTLPPA